jgi:hypothetical protein
MSLTESEMHQEMSKPIFVAMPGLQWFLLLALFEQVLKMDNVFATEQDRESCRDIFKTIHNQSLNKEDKSLIDMLSLKPKKIITKPDLIV